MRPLLLAVFVGLALAKVDEEAFKPARQYIYRYQAQLMTSAPQSSQLFSGLLLSAKLHLFFHNETTVTAKLTDVNLQKMDKFVDNHTPMFFMQPEDKLLDGIESNIDSVMVPKLQKSFSFCYMRGQVKQIGFNPEDSEWSINIKRGILGLFVVNLDKHYSVNPVPDLSLKYDAQQESYTVWEESIAGYCLTTYTPTLDSGSDQFYLTKVRHYSSCLEPAPMSYVFNNFHPERQNSNEHLNIQAEVTYAIKGNTNNFIILYAGGDNKIVFVPYAREDGTVQTSVNQTLVLLDAVDITKPRPTPVTLNQGERMSLKLNLPVESVMDLEPYILIKQTPEEKARLAKQTPRWSVEKMDQLLRRVANGTFTYPSDDVLMTMQTLMEMIRQSRAETLKQLLDRISNSTQPQEKLLSPLKIKIYTDLLMSTGTTGAAYILLDKCLKMLEKDAPPTQLFSCVSAVTSIAIFTPPSGYAILALRVLMLESHTKEPQLYKASMLALGAVIGRAEDMLASINRQARMQIQAMQNLLRVHTTGNSTAELERCLEDLQERVAEINKKHLLLTSDAIKDIMKTVKKGYNDTQLILVLETFRNAHIPSTFEHIERILLDVKLSTPVRIAAARAFEKFPNKYDKPLKTLERVLKNHTEVVAIRMQAFRTMVNLDIPTHTLIRLASTVPYKQKKQLSTYAWSMFNIMANSSYPPYEREAARFRAAIPFMQPVQPGIQDSQYHHYHIQLTNNLALLEETSYISDSLAVVVDWAKYLRIFGANNKVVQISMTTEAVVKLLKQFLGPEGFFTNNNSFFDLLKRSKRGINSKDLIKKIFNKLRIKARNPDEVRAFLSLQLMNNVIRSYDLSDAIQSIADLKAIDVKFDEAKLKMGLSFAHQTSGIACQYFAELPTEAGFPVTLQTGFSYTANVTGELAAGVEASFFKETRGNKLPKSMHARLSLQPVVVASVMGKMAADGYIFQTGYLFHALTTLQTPFTVNTTVNMVLNRLNVSLSPPVMSSPVLKVEMKPYVYSRAVAYNIPPKKPMTENVNRRPIFTTMQPTMISNGAKIKQMKKTFAGNLLGYNITWQGEHLWRAIPSATACPMLGRAKYALYITPGLNQPASLRLDVRYITQPLYLVNSSSLDVQEPVKKKGSCDSWNILKCFGIDEDDSVNEEDGEDITSSVLRYPPMDSPISLMMLKDMLEKDTGHNIVMVPSAIQQGFIAILNSSSDSLERSMILKVMLQKWKKGQYLQTFLSFIRSAIPGYDPEPFKLTVKMLSVFPSEMLTARGLVDPVHQKKTSSAMFQMMKLKEHKVVNMFFRELLFTYVNKYAIQTLPSMDPQIMLDRIFPEFLLMQNDSYIEKVGFIVKLLLPLSHQMGELKEELKDALQIPIKEDVLLQLGNNILLTQRMLIKLLVGLTKNNNTVTLGVKASTEYAVLKLTQAVLDFKEIIERAINLDLDPQSQFAKLLLSVNARQLQVYKRCVVALSKTPLEIIPSKPNDPPVTFVQVQSLMALIKVQLENIRDVWAELVKRDNRSVVETSELINQTTENVTMLNEVIKQADVEKNVTWSQLILQAATQHQILVRILSMSDRDNGTHFKLNSFDHYALKVQTKELLERGYVLQQQIKDQQICFDDLTIDEKKVVHDLLLIDRQLVAVQNDHMPLPSKNYPWTTNASNLYAAEMVFNLMLKKLTSVRDTIMMLPELPQPCLLSKLVITTTLLQQRIGLFKRTLLAQYDYPAWLIVVYEEQEEMTMDFVLSLSEIFDKFVHQLPDEEKPELFPQGSIFISESMLEVTRIHAQQLGILKQLRQFLFQYGRLPIHLVQEILQTSTDEAFELFKALEAVADSVKSSMQTTTMLSALNLYAQYMNALQQQSDIYEIVEQHLKLNKQQPDLPDLLPQIKNSMEKVEMIKREASGWSLPGQKPISASDSKLLETTATPVLHADQGVDNGFMDFLFGDSSQEEEQPLSEEVVLADSASEDQDQTDIPPPPHPIGIDGIYFNANISYSPNNTIALKIHAKKSMEQLLWQMAQFFPVSRDRSITQALEEIFRDKREMMTSEGDVNRKLNTYNHIHLHVAADQEMPPMLMKRLHGLMRFLDKTNYDRTYFMEAMPFIENNSMQAILDFSQLMDSVDLYLMTTKKTMVIESSALLPYANIIYPFQNIDTLPREALKKLSDGRLPAVCRVTHKTVETPDGAVYSLPLRTPRNVRRCPTLLAMDCSQDMTFAILLHPNPNGPAQIVEILAEQYKVQLIPKMFNAKVKINDMDVNIKNGSPLVFNKQIAYGQEAVAMVVSYEPAGQTHVELPLAGLDIFYDLRSVHIEMSSVHKSQLCGLCAKEGPKGSGEVFSITELYLSYVITDPQCQAKTPIRPRRPSHGRGQKRKVQKQT